MQAIMEACFVILSLYVTNHTYLQIWEKKSELQYKLRILA